MKKCHGKCAKFVPDKKEPDFCRYWDIVGHWEKIRYTSIDGVCTIHVKRIVQSLEETIPSTAICGCGTVFERKHKGRKLCDACRYVANILYKKKQKLKNKEVG